MPEYNATEDRTLLLYNKSNHSKQINTNFSNLGKNVDQLKSIGVENVKKNNDILTRYNLEKQFKEIVVIPYSTLIALNSDFGNVVVNPTTSIESLFNKINTKEIIYLKNGDILKLNSKFDDIILPKNVELLKKSKLPIEQREEKITAEDGESKYDKQINLEFPNNNNNKYSNPVNFLSDDYTKGFTENFSLFSSLFDIKKIPFNIPIEQRQERITAEDGESKYDKQINVQFPNNIKIKYSNPVNFLKDIYTKGFTENLKLFSSLFDIKKIPFNMPIEQRQQKITAEDGESKYDKQINVQFPNNIKIKYSNPVNFLKDTYTDGFLENLQQGFSYFKPNKSDRILKGKDIEFKINNNEYSNPVNFLDKNPNANYTDEGFKESSQLFTSFYKPDKKTLISSGDKFITFINTFDEIKSPTTWYYIDSSIPMIEQMNWYKENRVFDILKKSNKLSTRSLLNFAFSSTFKTNITKEKIILKQKPNASMYTNMPFVKESPFRNEFYLSNLKSDLKSLGIDALEGMAKNVVINGIISALAPQASSKISIGSGESKISGMDVLGESPLMFHVLAGEIYYGFAGLPKPTLINANSLTKSIQGFNSGVASATNTLGKAIGGASAKKFLDKTSSIIKGQVSNLINKLTGGLVSEDLISIIFNIIGGTKYTANKAYAINPSTIKETYNDNTLKPDLYNKLNVRDDNINLFNKYNFEKKYSKDIDSKFGWQVVQYDSNDVRSGEIDYGWNTYADKVKKINELSSDKKLTNLNIKENTKNNKIHYGNQKPNEQDPLKYGKSLEDVNPSNISSNIDPSTTFNNLPKVPSNALFDTVLERLVSKNLEGKYINQTDELDFTLKKETDFKYGNKYNITQNIPGTGFNNLYQATEDTLYSKGFPDYKNDSQKQDMKNMMSVLKENRKNFSYEDDDLIDFYFIDITTKPGGSDDVLVIPFRAIITDIGMAVNATWDQQDYIGRPDKFFIYQGFDRKGNVSFTVTINSEEEFESSWQKLNYLFGHCFPVSYPKNISMRPPIMQLKLGNYYDYTIIVLNSVQFSIKDSYPWEIKKDKQLPMYIDVAVDFNVIYEKAPYAHMNHIASNQSWMSPRIQTTKQNRNDLKILFGTRDGSFVFKSNITDTNKNSNIGELTGFNIKTELDMTSIMEKADTEFQKKVSNQNALADQNLKILEERQNQETINQFNQMDQMNKQFEEQQLKELESQYSTQKNIKRK